MNYRYFEKLRNVKEYWVNNNIFVWGVEIIEGAEPIHKATFKGDTLFMLGNEGTGLNQNQIKIWDHFVYISQFTGKTASLNVACAGSIIMHSFALWAWFQEHSIKWIFLSLIFSNRVGHKYLDPEGETIEGKHIIEASGVHSDESEKDEAPKERQIESEIVPIKVLSEEKD